ncbi:hypothetical protein D915_000988 [Fasciola hepatica]|uniref:Uncharacterized protein n=1 Tax=Fasciola hepatica TaxID=6192 RepID=A0A4E0RN15_FASHE|nr:hypothetical protein D915_000988 [Fasciola hepatica]
MILLIILFVSSTNVVGRKGPNSLLRKDEALVEKKVSEPADELPTMEQDPNNAALNKWLTKKPRRDTPEVSPMAGYFYPEKSGDILLKLDNLRELPSFRCYTCTGCDDILYLDEITIASDCTECVILLRSSGLLDRLCNHKPYTHCREDFRARCCQGDLCNRGKKSRSSSHAFVISTVTIIFMECLHKL